MTPEITRIFSSPPASQKMAIGEPIGDLNQGGELNRPARQQILDSVEVASSPPHTGDLGDLADVRSLATFATPLGVASGELPGERTAEGTAA